MLRITGGGGGNGFQVVHPEGFSFQPASFAIGVLLFSGYASEV